MEEEICKNGVINHFEKDSNCQVFNGDIRDCVFAMPGSHVTQQASPKSLVGENAPEQVKPVDKRVEREGKTTLFVHPSVDENHEWQIHDEIVRLVTRQGIQEICKYLLKLSNEDKVLLPQNAEKAYKELVRLGMPDGDGYSLKTFMKYYKR
jgi:hypothetical protein